MIAKRSKHYTQSATKVPDAQVPIAQAVSILKSFDKLKFDQTVELAMHLGIDPRQADQALRGSISLPHGIGKARKVIAFCDGDDVAKATEAGATEVGGDELVKKIQDGWMDFDVALATPKMMKSVSKLGRVLGPQGKMPSPKAGTVTPDIAQGVREYAAGKLEYRNDEGGNLHVPVGKMSFDEAKLVENIEAFVTYIKKIKPSTTKGIYIKKACLSATMSPSICLDLSAHSDAPKE